MANWFCALRSVLENPGATAGSRSVLPWGAVAGIGAALALPLNAKHNHCNSQSGSYYYNFQMPPGQPCHCGETLFSSSQGPRVLGGDREAGKIPLDVGGLPRVATGQAGSEGDEVGV